MQKAVKSPALLAVLIGWLLCVCGIVATSACATHTWNTDHRLTQVQIAQGQSVNKTIRYGYDPQGRRVKKLVTEGANTTETHYVLDTERTFHEIVIERTRINGGPWQERSYLHTPGGVGELLSESDGSTTGTSSTRQIYSDGQGSVRLAIDGTDTQSWSFDAFGNLQANSSAPITHGYTGERYDPDTGLIHLRARDYDPQTGRFISMDEHPGSQRIPLTLNKYLYANADPVNHVDPSGYWSMASVGAAITNFSISISVRLTLVGAKLATKFPKLSFAANLLASVLMPMEIQLAAGQANFSGFANMTYTAMWNNAHQLSAMARAFGKQGNFIGVGGNLEEFVVATTNLAKNERRFYVGSNRYFVPDFVLAGGNALLETKSSIGAVSNAQLLKYSEWMQRGNGTVTFLFFKKPSATELAKKEKYIYDILGPGAPVPQIAYIFE